MWLIGTKKQAEAYNAKATKAIGHSGNSTQQWATPRKHPDKDKYAIKKAGNIQPDSDMKEVEELPSDWFPKDDLT
jgi:hypothetical protein